jgi:CcmD family protein
MKKLKYLFLLMMLTSLPTFAQNQVEEFFRTDDKFYVVVAVLAIIMVGLLFYIIRLDRKITHLEKNTKHNKD